MELEIDGINIISTIKDAYLASSKTSNEQASEKILYESKLTIVPIYI